MQRMIALEELVLNCRTDLARSYISEAVSCYNASAYRACIVTTWIAVVFDLIDKIRELAIAGETFAQELINKFKKYQEQIEQGNNQGIRDALEFERTILEKAKNQLELLTHQQYDDLEQLRKARHLCAHPSFQKIEEPYIPSAELARLHLRNAVEHVLKQLPVQGKSALKELEASVESQYFPEKLEDAILLFSKSPLARPTISLIRSFVDKLVLGLNQQDSKLKGKKKTITAINACLEMHRFTTEERLKKLLNNIVKKADDESMFLIVKQVFLINQGWEFIELDSKNKIKEYIRSASTEQVIKLLNLAFKIPELEEVVNQRINQFNIDELSVVINTSELKKELVNAAVEHLCGVKCWRDANDAFGKLIFPLFEYLNKDDILVIMRAPLERDADLIGSGGFLNFLKTLKGSAILTDEEFNNVLAENGKLKKEWEFQTEHE